LLIADGLKRCLLTDVDEPECRAWYNGAGLIDYRARDAAASRRENRRDCEYSEERGGRERRPDLDCPTMRSSGLISDVLLS
jgi:hypothetical protein